MSVSIGPWLGLISIVLFLLPGLGGIKLGLRIAERGDWLSRLETTGLSFALSLAAMYALYFLGSLYMTCRNAELHLLTQENLVSWLSTLPSIALGYLILIVFALFGGALLGCLDFGAHFFDPILPWANFHQLAKQSGDGETYAVRVRTIPGDELRGKVEDEGEAALNKDIILENPLRLRFNDEGEVADDRSWTGNAYIHSQSIAHVEFDRLEDADATEAAAYDKDEQQTLQDSSGEDDKKEMEQLETLAEETQDQDTD